MLSFFKNLIGKNEETTSEIAAEAAVVTKLSELQVGDYKIKPLDAVLWAATDPKDPLASIIKRIELHECVPKIEHPFHELWTHSGIIVDKTVLPLDCLEDGKLYVFESVMAGQIAGIM
ncbi:UNVERIFIED_CONTAM: hypothetical protein HDU68_006939, partial [Siphonaria sp. JEL0065]